MSVAHESAAASSQVEPPPWESPDWQEAIRQNPGLKPFFDNLESFVELPEGVEKLRELSLDLAMQGRLTEPRTNDDSAVQLYEDAVDAKVGLADRMT